MTPELIQSLFAYHYAGFERIWACLAELNHEQFVEDCDYSLGSVRNQLAHCMNVDDRWAARLQGSTPPKWRDADDFPDQESMRAQWRVVRERVLGIICDFTEDDLNETIPLSLPHRFPESKWNARREVLLHMVNHGTDHRAQILARLHQLGGPTFEQDLILHLWAADSD